MGIKKCTKCKKIQDLNLFYSGSSWCKQCCKEQKKIFYIKNREKILKNVKKYSKINRDKILKYNKKYKEINRDKIIKYYHRNKNYCKIKNKQYFCIKENLLKRTVRTRLYRLVGSMYKNINISTIIGISLTKYKCYIEKKLKDGMSWDNYGRTGWHIDHIIPCSSFDLTKEKEMLSCFNYKNTQPLWFKDNIKKGNKYEHQNSKKQ